MKKVTKPIIMSALSALAFGSLGVAGTFALFTDKAETQIVAEAGIIDVGTTASIYKVFEYNGTEAGLEVEATATDDYTNSIGGTTKKQQDGTFALGKWAPGDRAQIKVNATNGSTVKAKVRLKAVLSGELAGALVIKIGNDTFTTVDLATQGARTLVTDWTEFDPGSNPANFGIEVSFPNVGTEITVNTQGENNLYQGKSATLLVTYEAVQANAQTDGVLEAINSKLATAAYNDGNNQTMYAALQDLSATQVSAIQERGYVWGAENDQFYETSSVQQGDEYKYFKMYASMPDSPTYSVYALNGFSTSQITLTGIGFDAGDASGIQSVYYGGANSARTNIIRTNSYDTAVTINAENDTVRHYGDAASVNIIAVAGSSYHEFGRVAFTEIATGRIVLEEGSETAQIHLNAQDEYSFAPITIANNGVPEAKLPAAITRDQIEVSAQAQKELVVTVKDLVNDTHEEVFAYPYSYEEQSVQIPAGTTEKTVEQNADVETALGMKVIDSNNHEGEKALAPAVKTEVKENVIENVVTEDAKEKSVNNKVRIGAQYFEPFEAAVAAATTDSTIKVFRDCEAYGRDATAYNLSGKNVAIHVEEDVTLDCGQVLNNKFVIGENNAAGTLTFEGVGKLTFNVPDNGTWGLVTNNGSGSEIKTVFKDITIEASAAGGKLMSHDASGATAESGYYKNIAFVAGQIAEGYEAKDSVAKPGYKEIVEHDPAEGKTFELTTSSGVTYFDETDIWKLTDAGTGVPANSTLKLLDDYTFVPQGSTGTYLINFYGAGITLDLNQHTLTIGGSQGYLFWANSCSNLTFTNGTIISGNTSKGRKLFSGDDCAENNFHSVGVEYGPEVLNPWTGLQMTPEVA